MNDLRLSAFAPRRRFSYAVSFDGYLKSISLALNVVSIAFSLFTIGYILANRGHSFEE